MSEVSFLPVLLASDINVYSMARAFHEEYGIKSLMVARGRGGITGKGMTNLFEYIEEPLLDKQDTFMKTMEAVFEKYGKDKTLFLFGCADHYVRLIVDNQDRLREMGFVVPYSPADVMDRLILKENFYKLCDEYGLDYPATFIYKPEMNFEFKLDFGFPAILKASDSVKVLQHKYPGYKKAYRVESMDELMTTLKNVYASGYDGNMILQNFIPGDDDSEYDLQMYVGTDHKIKLMNFGNVILEEHTPTAIGNNAATITSYNEELMRKVGHMMEDIGYVGFADADIKYDSRDGKFKLFEINIRQGRSHYRVTGGGNNIAKLAVDDWLLHKELPEILVKDAYFWHIVPLGVVYKYVRDPEKIAQVKKLVSEGKVCDSSDYPADMPFKRRIYLILRKLNFYKKFRKYYL